MEYDMDLAGLLLNNLADRPDEPYIITADRALSYEQAFNIIQRIRQVYLNNSAGQEVIALNIGQPAMLCLSIWACILEGKSIVLLPALKDSAQVAYHLKEAGCTAVLSDILRDHTMLPDLLSMDMPEAPERRDNISRMPRACSPEGGCVYFLTSGTTAASRLIAVTYQQIAYSLACIARCKVMPYTYRQHVLITVPLFHSYGFSSLMEYTVGASAIVLPSDREYIGPVKALLNKKLNHTITAIEGVPHFYRQIGALAGRYTWENIRHIGFGGDFIDKPLVEALGRVFPSAGCSVRYGVSELPSVVSLKVYDSLGFDTCDCAGKVLPIYHLPLGDMEDDITVCYKADVGDGAPEVVRIDTGDIGVMINGELYIRGRAGHFIKNKGYRIYPVSIENVACQHEFVLEAFLQQQAHKLVLRVLATEQWELMQFRAFLQQQLPEYMMPDVIEKTNTIARTASGKIIRGPQMVDHP